MTIQVADLLDRSERVDCGKSNRHPFDLYARQPIDLDCGIIAEISSMYQFCTYGGKLCGFPMPDDLEWHINHAARSAERLFPSFEIRRAAIFPPQITFGTTISNVSPDMATRLGLEADAKERRVAWEMLPKITTVAVLKMTASFDSVLAIWWQEELGYPDSNVLDQIRKLSWADHAVENDP